MANVFDVIDTMCDTITFLENNRRTNYFLNDNQNLKVFMSENLYSVFIVSAKFKMIRLKYDTIFDIDSSLSNYEYKFMSNINVINTINDLYEK